MDRNLKKAIHKDLEKYNSEEPSENIKQAIEFLKKYSRNKDGKPYPEDEIINFLKQKNEIIITKYDADDETFKEYQDSTYINGRNDLLYQVTGRRH